MASKHLWSSYRFAELFQHNLISGDGKFIGNDHQVKKYRTFQLQQARDRTAEIYKEKKCIIDEVSKLLKEENTSLDQSEEFKYFINTLGFEVNGNGLFTLKGEQVSKEKVLQTILNELTIWDRLIITCAESKNILDGDLKILDDWLKGLGKAHFVMKAYKTPREWRIIELKRRRRENRLLRDMAAARRNLINRINKNNDENLQNIFGKGWQTRDEVPDIYRVDSYSWIEDIIFLEFDESTMLKTSIHGLMQQLLHDVEVNLGEEVIKTEYDTGLPKSILPIEKETWLKFVQGRLEKEFSQKTWGKKKVYHEELSSGIQKEKAAHYIKTAVDQRIMGKKPSAIRDVQKAPVQKKTTAHYIKYGSLRKPVQRRMPMERSVKKPDKVISLPSNKKEKSSYFIAEDKQKVLPGIGLGKDLRRRSSKGVVGKLDHSDRRQTVFVKKLSDSDYNVELVVKRDYKEIPEYIIQKSIPIKSDKAVDVQKAIEKGKLETETQSSAEAQLSKEKYHIVHDDDVFTRRRDHGLVQKSLPEDTKKSSSKIPIASAGTPDSSKEYIDESLSLETVIRRSVKDLSSKRGDNADFSVTDNGKRRMSKIPTKDLQRRPADEKAKKLDSSFKGSRGGLNRSHKTDLKIQKNSTKLLKQDLTQITAQLESDAADDIQNTIEKKKIGTEIQSPEEAKLSEEKCHVVHEDDVFTPDKVHGLSQTSLPENKQKSSSETLIASAITPSVSKQYIEENLSLENVIKRSVEVLSSKRRKSADIFTAGKCKATMGELPTKDLRRESAEEKANKLGSSFKEDKSGREKSSDNDHKVDLNTIKGSTELLKQHAIQKTAKSERFKENEILKMRESQNLTKEAEEKGKEIFSKKKGKTAGERDFLCDEETVEYKTDKEDGTSWDCKISEKSIPGTSSQIVPDASLTDIPGTSSPIVPGTSLPDISEPSSQMVPGTSTSLPDVAGTSSQIIPGTSFPEFPGIPTDDVLQLMKKIELYEEIRATEKQDDTPSVLPVDIELTKSEEIILRMMEKWDEGREQNLRIHRLYEKWLEKTKKRDI